MIPIAIAKGESVPVVDLDPHSIARITIPVVTPLDDYAVLRAVEKLLDPNERRRFRFLWREASRGGAGVRPAIKIALQRQMEEATVRLATALREVGTMSLAEKYDITHTWEEPCSGCGEPVTMTAAKSEVLGPYYEGCFGWPACVCEVAHQGECSESGHS